MLKEFIEFNESEGSDRAETMRTFYRNKHYRRVLTLEFLVNTERIDHPRYRSETLLVALDMVDASRRGESVLNRMAKAGLLVIGTVTAGGRLT